MDEELRIVGDLRSGKEEALGRLMDRYGSSVLRTAVMILGDRHMAEDMSQEVFLIAYRRIGDFRGEGSLRSWLLQITINQCRACMRRASWRRLLFRAAVDEAPKLDRGRIGSGHQHQEPTTNWLNSFSLREELEKLTLPDREVIILFYYHDLSMKDIAAILRQPEGTVKSKLQRARKKLKIQLEEGGWGSEQGRALER